MSAEFEPVECSTCDVEMQLVSDDSHRSVPLIGTEVEYRRYSCPECGQGVRYEREAAGEEWTQPGV